MTVELVGGPFDGTLHSPSTMMGAGLPSAIVYQHGELDAVYNFERGPIGLDLAVYRFAHYVPEGSPEV